MQALVIQDRLDRAAQTIRQRLLEALACGDARGKASGRRSRACSAFTDQEIGTYFDLNWAQNQSCTTDDPRTSSSLPLNMLYCVTAAAGSGLREQK
jgi:hypothetical protein